MGQEVNISQLETYEKMLKSAELAAAEEKIRTIQQEQMINLNDKSMIQEQLDLGEDLDRIDYLLRGYTLGEKSGGGRGWIPPTNDDMKILSEYGIHLIRNTIAWYLNKNTLLSNYDDTTIRQKMEDFSTDLADTIFMEYEKVFLYPTFEACKAVLNERIKNKQQLREYALEVIGKKIDDADKINIRRQILEELEPIIEQELEKIKAQLMKNKLKRFLLLVRVIQDAVHSTYNRAFGGQERKTLREHAHISETRGGHFIPQQTNGGILGFFKRK